MKDQTLYSDDASLRDKVANLLSLQLFSKDVIENIYANTRIRTFESGETILKEGETNTWIYFIISGKVEAVRENDVIMKLRRHGDIIGLLSFMDEKPHPFTVRALEQTQCLAMDASLLQTLNVNKHMDFHYIIYRIFAETLAEQLRMVMTWSP